MADPNRALFESVVRLLAPVLDDLVFVGGCTTGLFITDPAAAGIRPTVDVDAIVDVASYAGYAALADRLRKLDGHRGVVFALLAPPTMWAPPLISRESSRSRVPASGPRGPAGPVWAATRPGSGT